jgi:hypothetical protein
MVDLLLSDCCCNANAFFLLAYNDFSGNASAKCPFYGFFVSSLYTTG